MSEVLTITEIKALVDRIYEQHPTARVDFVYPKRHGGKVRSALGGLTSYSVLLGSPAVARFVIDWAREGSKFEVEESLETSETK